MNIIKQSSQNSSVTIPYERSFRNISKTPEDERLRDEFNFCGCGWPQHMLIPKGKPEGMTFDLFAMISDYEEDRVEQPDGTPICADSSSFCGLKDKKYPDKRAMGYPFDRRLLADNLNSMVSNFSNMKIAEVTIKFSNKVVDRKKN